MVNIFCYNDAHKTVTEQNTQAPVTHPLQTIHTPNTHKGSFLNYPDIAESML
jgi:hypothetical protein